MSWLQALARSVLFTSLPVPLRARLWIIVRLHRLDELLDKLP